MRNRPRTPAPCRSPACPAEPEKKAKDNPYEQIPLDRHDCPAGTPEPGTSVNPAIVRIPVTSAAARPRNRPAVMDVIQPYLDYFSANPELGARHHLPDRHGRGAAHHRAVRALDRRAGGRGRTHRHGAPELLAGHHRHRHRRHRGRPALLLGGPLLRRAAQDHVAPEPLSPARRQGRGFRARARRQERRHRALRAGREVGRAGRRRHAWHEPALFRHRQRDLRRSSGPSPMWCRAC